MSILLGLFATAILYAILLSSSWGREWTDHQTWTTVVFGTLLVIAWMWMEDPALAERVLLYFTVAGAPMVVRSLVFQFLRHRAIMRRIMGEE